MRGKSDRTSPTREVSGTRPVITCKPGALRALFTAEGITSWEAMAAELGYQGLGTLSRALKGAPVSAGFISVVRRRFPEVPYERTFTEGTVTVDASANAAA